MKKTIAFVLVHYKSSSLHRASGETKDYSIDFLTKKIKITKNETENKAESTEWKTFTLEKLMSIKSLKKPFELNFEGIYL